MLTEHQLIKKLCSKEYIKHIYIISPYLENQPVPLKGFYLNENKSVYFYSDDKIGLGFSKHFNSLMVKDYLGRYRPFITKLYEDASLNKVSYETAFDLDNQDPEIRRSGFYKLMVPWYHIKPGDFILEDPDDDPNAANTIVHYHEIVDNNPVYEIFYMVQTPGQHFLPFGEIQKSTYQHPQAMEEYIYTLIPLDVKAYETVH